MYIVLGANGHVGSAVATELLEAGLHVTVVLRNPQQASQWQARGAEVSICDINDVDRLHAVFRTGRRAFLLNPPAPVSQDTDQLEHRTLNSITRALDGSELEKIVLESTYGATAGRRIGDLSVLHDFEQALAATGIPTTILRAAYYMSNWDPLLDSAREGVLPTFFPPEMILPMVAPHDIGRTAATLLRQPSQDPGIAFVEGPARYFPTDVAAAFSAALGRPVELVVTPRDEWQKTYERMGFSRAAADSYARMTAVTIESGADLPEDPIRGSVSLREYVESLVNRGS